jgi:hypothetical protein
VLACKAPRSHASFAASNAWKSRKIFAFFGVLAAFAPLIVSFSMNWNRGWSSVDNGSRTGDVDKDTIRRNFVASACLRMSFFFESLDVFKTVV